MSDFWTPTPYGVRPASKSRDIAPPPPSKTKKGVSKVGSSSTVTSKIKKVSTKKKTSVAGVSLNSPPPHPPSQYLNSHITNDTDSHSTSSSTANAASKIQSPPIATTTTSISTSQPINLLQKKPTAGVDTPSTGRGTAQSTTWTEMSAVATQEMNKISSKDLAELKGFRNPPEVVKLIVTAILTLFGERDTSWPACIDFLSTKQLISVLLAYNLDEVSPLRLKKLTRLVDKEMFTLENAKKYSKAVAAMCGWVLAVHQYKTTQQQQLLAQAKTQAQGQGSSHDLLIDHTLDSLENYDGIPREYDLLNSTTQQQPSTKKKKASTIPSHLKAIELLNSDELGKIPLKDQLKGLHRELSEETFENLLLDESPDFRDIHHQHQPQPQPQQLHVSRGEDISIANDEPFYFEPEDSRDLLPPTVKVSVKPAPKPSPPPSGRQPPARKASSSLPLPPPVSSKSPSSSVSSATSTPPAQDRRYAQKLGGGHGPGAPPPPPVSHSMSNSKSKSSPPVPSKDTSYSQGHHVGAQGGELIVPPQSLSQPQRMERQQSVAQEMERERGEQQLLQQREEEAEDAAVLVKFAELIIDTSRVQCLPPSDLTRLMCLTRYNMA